MQLRKRAFWFHVSQSCYCVGELADKTRDRVSGLPSVLQDLELTITFGIFEGAESRRDLEFTSALCRYDGNDITAKFSKFCPFGILLPIKDTRVILELRAQEPGSIRYAMLLGWTSFDLFQESNLAPDYGTW